jgi:hypothetical protein
MIVSPGTWQLRGYVVLWCGMQKDSDNIYCTTQLSWSRKWTHSSPSTKSLTCQVE